MEKFWKLTKLFVILIMLIKSNDLRKYPLLMIFGGAIGNLYDRIVYRAVVDFIDLHVADFHWPAFNLADIYITIGIIMLIISIFIKSEDNK